jgi:hypothetical protein
MFILFLKFIYFIVIIYKIIICMYVKIRCNYNITHIKYITNSNKYNIILTI